MAKAKKGGKQAAKKVDKPKVDKPAVKAKPVVKKAKTVTKKAHKADCPSCAVSNAVRIPVSYKGKVRMMCSSCGRVFHLILQ